ncbi:hypothetical protein [Burkholderia multivorans]|uniref:hypothetical protein n=1 Tax=Burkholderia multivorans TaxID=87883 RepID=UPI000DACCDE2|nr:hypothetical protein [Burkholderia multivorans]MBU9203057.1 hypothetical protein [Burkholderia multivorans]MBU9662266.1 hypothetical protein [Burkholderia multivorans]MCO8354033.1 hypothetical protein [Burkholderia multivorans]MCO8386304.1 hypothetical protein [Burkholderia multivorans]MCO8408814.1 hypothetical protein [Burkholderia multivorans]
MTPDDKFPTTHNGYDALLPRDIAVLESAVQSALESFERLTAHFTKLTAIARFALHIEMREEDRRYVLQAMKELSEQGEEDLQRRHDALRLTASRYWLARYGGEANRKARH